MRWHFATYYKNKEEYATSTASQATKEKDRCLLPIYYMICGMNQHAKFREMLKALLT
jgi:hypothetical protein